MTDVIFVHGMFQSPKSWERWVGRFEAKGYTCSAPAWPFHDEAPRVLRDKPPPGLGDLSLADVIGRIEREVAGHSNAVMIGHSVGGLITQIMLNRGAIAVGVAIDPLRRTP